MDGWPALRAPNRGSRLAMRISLLKRTAEGLDRLFAPFSAGELKQYELPLEVEQFYQLGLVQGMAYAQQIAREYEHRLNVLYMQAYTPKERHAEYMRRLDEHFRLEDQRFFAVEEESNHDSDSPRVAA